MRHGSSQTNINLRDVHRESSKLNLQRNDPRHPSAFNEIYPKSFERLENDSSAGHGTQRSPRRRFSHLWSCLGQWVNDTMVGMDKDSSSVFSGITISYIKAFVQHTTAPASTVVGSPTATLSAPLANHVVGPSYSGATIPSVPCKRKVVAPDTSATSSKKPSSVSLIENVDMGEFIKGFHEDQGSPSSLPPHTRFPNRGLCAVLLFHSFILGNWTIVFFIFSLHFF